MNKKVALASLFQMETLKRKGPQIERKFGNENYQKDKSLKNDSKHLKQLEPITNFSHKKMP